MEQKLLHSSIFPEMITISVLKTHLLCAERLTEGIVSGMEMYISHFFSQPKSSKAWFNTAIFVLYMIERLPTKGT